jgi:hypothetical protein
MLKIGASSGEEVLEGVPVDDFDAPEVRCKLFRWSSHLIILCASSRK